MTQDHLSQEAGFHKVRSEKKVRKEDILSSLSALEHGSKMHDGDTKEQVKFKQRDMSPPYIGHREPASVGPPALHRFCLTVTQAADIKEAKELLTTIAASEADAIGRLAMHCLSDNTALAEAMAYPEDPDNWTNPLAKQAVPFSPMSQSSRSTHRGGNRRVSGPRKSFTSAAAEDENLEESVCDFVVNGLLKAYPAAMISPDANGHVPFEAVLVDWVEDSSEIPDEDHGTRSRLNSTDKFRSVSDLVNRTLGVSGMFSKRTVKEASIQDFNGNGSHTQSSGSNTLRDVEGAKESDRPASPKSLSKFDTVFPSNVKLTASAYYAIQIVSAILDSMDAKRSTTRVPSFQSPTTSLFSPENGKTTSIEGLKDATADDIRSEIVHSMASIPGLAKTILLIEDEEQRAFVMSTKLVQSILAHPASVGNWLTYMLQSRDQHIVDLAIGYLQLVSKDSFWIKALALSNQHACPTRDTKQIEIILDQKKADLYNQVSQLDNFVPSLLSLGGKFVEEAATTTLVRRVLDGIIARPFCVTFVFCDALFLAVMIVGFRMAVYRLIMHEPPGNILRYVYISNMGIFYFVVRELGKFVSLSMVTHRARFYFLSFWNATDLLATVLALASTVSIRFHFSEQLAIEGEDLVEEYLRYLLTVTTGFLWLRVLSFLKGINMQLATFVLAILQISRDVLWFCVIVITLLISFAQMFFTLMAPGTCGVEPDNPACLQSEYYLQVYSMLLAPDFDRDAFDSRMSIVLVVIYTFMVVLVLLNVLIAISSDSYEKCLVRSQNLFGRARIMMIAEMVSFQNLLRRTAGEAHPAAIYKAWWSKDAAAGWSRGSIMFFGLSSAVLALWIIAEMGGYFAGPGYGSILMRLSSLLVTVVLFVCIIFFLSFGAGNETGVFGKHRKTRWDGYAAGVSGRVESIVHRIVLRLLGSTANGGTVGAAGDSNFDEEWSGRINFLKKEMTRLAEEQRLATSEQVQSLGVSLREDLSKLERSLEVTQQESVRTAAVSPEDIPEMLVLAIEALQKVQKTLG